MTEIESTQMGRPVVVVIAPDPPGSRGGIARISAAVSEAARTGGWEVRELNLGRGRFARLRLVAEAVRALARRDRIAVFMHVNQAPIGMVAPWARRIVWTHGLEVWRPLKLTRRLALRSASRVVSVSQFTARQVETRHGVTAVVVANPVVASLVGPSNPTAPGNQLLMVSRLDADSTEKGLDISIRAWAATLSSVHTIDQLVIVGTGFETQRLRELVESLGISDRVTFLGEIDDHSLNEQYEAARALLAPSTIEGFGLTAAEAMSHGRAVVGCDEGAIPELIEHLSNGLLVSPSTEGVSEAIIVLDDPDEASRLGRRAYATAAAFTSARFAQAVTELLSVYSCGPTTSPNELRTKL